MAKVIKSLVEEFPSKEVELRQPSPKSPVDLEISLLTGCKDRHYALAVSMAIASKGVKVDLVGSDEIDSPEFHNNVSLRFLNFLPDYKPTHSFAQRLRRLVAYYSALMRYVAGARVRILHILWNNKFELFDRTILMLYYKALQRKVVLTAHNVNQAKRDAKDSWTNRVTLRLQYSLCDHIFVHTEQMKRELCEDFAVAPKAVTVIPYPINSAPPDTELTSPDAKRRLGLKDGEKAILFFGRVRPSKGLEYLIDAFRLLSSTKQLNYRLIIAGEPLKGCEEYIEEIHTSVSMRFDQSQILARMQFIPDQEVEVYFKAADLLVLPYKDIFQSGVLFLAYSFGLPVVATDVGSFREEIIEGKTGFVCKPADPQDLADTIQRYFHSDIYRELAQRRVAIRDYGRAYHSWDRVGELTRSAYVQL